MERRSTIEEDELRRRLMSLNKRDIVEKFLEFRHLKTNEITQLKGIITLQKQELEEIKHGDKRVFRM